MFQPVSSKISFPQLEEDILRFWREHDIFHKSIESRPADRQFTFYEGPPYANAAPGIHHVLARVFKDVVVRYKTMRGYRVPRKAGWDTHGLPAEMEVERELGIKSKAEIEESVGIEEFNRRCRENVLRYLKDWEALTERIAFWVDLEDAYITFRNEYIESCWWIVKQLWDRGLLYQDYRVTPHCPRCGTSLSDHEVAQGYREDTLDPSIYVKFRLTEESRRRLADRVPQDLPMYFLAWTTTPWTLPGNTALAVQRYAEYAVVEANGQGLILASALAEAAVPGGRVVATLSGEDLLGLTYEPLYEPEKDWDVEARGFARGQPSLAPWTDIPLGEERELERLSPLAPGSAYKPSRRVVAADFVSLTDGTGIVHIAPAFGGEDFELGRAEGLLFVQPVDLRGNMLAKGTPFDGLFVKDADPLIMEDLAGRGLLFRRETIRHTYPFCWRCDSPLLYYAKPTWYIRTTAVKDRLIEGNQRINWYPEHIKHGRFGDWLENNVDWALSRERYWGTPLPIWRCQVCREAECIGSRDELREKAQDGAQVEALTDLHRPYIDRVLLRCKECGGTMARVPEVMDVWFDSGAMPYAQWHYPFENRETFQRSFPADFICEAVDQTRGWFYTLHALATLLHNADAVPQGLAYRNCLCLELILDEKGDKMSKSRGNVVEPWSVLNAHGADAVRWYMFTATPPWVPRRFSPNLVAESLRRFLLTLWNTYSFFVTYANIDGFDPRTEARGQPSELDRWILSEMNVLVDRATSHLEAYNPTDAGRAIQSFVEDLSNWYVRRSRRRFWKSEDDADKLSAHQTLYTCLVTLSRLLAPFTPFLAEAMYQNLVRSFFPEAPESVHLADWPQVDPTQVDRDLMEATRLAMRIVSLGRAARSQAGIKVRQPLARAAIKPRYPAESSRLRLLAAQIAEELNVKALDFVETDAALTGLKVASDEAGYAVGLDTTITQDLADEGLARELVHRLQDLRKSAGLDIADRIEVYYRGPDRLRQVLAKHGDYVRQETLARSIDEGDPPPGAYAETRKLEGQEVTLAVRRI